MNPPRPPPTPPPLRLMPSHDRNTPPPITKSRIIDDICAILIQEIRAVYITPQGRKRFLKRGEIDVCITNAINPDLMAEDDVLYVDQVNMLVSEPLIEEARIWLVQDDTDPSDETKEAWEWLGRNSSEVFSAIDDVYIVVVLMREKLIRKLNMYSVEKLKDSNYIIWLTACIAEKGRKKDEPERSDGSMKFGSVAEVPTFQEKKGRQR